jgi:hypothetical protein
MRRQSRKREVIAPNVRSDSRKHVKIDAALKNLRDSVARGLGEIAKAKVVGSFAEYADDEL